MIRLKNIDFAFDSDQMILSDVSLQANTNQIVSIVGKSGSGKSTIFNLISGLLTPCKGEILIDGSIVTFPTLKTSYQRQHAHLLNYRTAFENALLGLELRDDLTKFNIEIAEEYFHIFNLSDAKSKYPKELSGGMRQRVSLIQSLIVNASIYLLDEPFSAIDSVTIKTIQDSIWNKIKDGNSSLVLVTHNMEQALEISDSIIVLSSLSGNIAKQMNFDSDFTSLSPSERKNSTKYTKHLFDLVKTFSEV